MSACYPSRPGPDRPFVITPYLERACNTLMPEVPTRCPACSAPEEVPCRLTTHHWRERKTGPCFPLAVVSCASHGGRAFTLYPPGYGPYLRQAVAQLAPDGSPVHGEEKDRLRRDFGGTLFEAALDARDGRPWPRETSGLPQRSWSSQGRHLSTARQILGLARDLAEPARETIAAVLSLDTLLLRERSGASGYRGIGAAICQVLAQLTGRARSALQILFCGHLTRRWGEPLQWETSRRTWEHMPFREATARA